jgi:AraC-like DNA-binding protein
MATATARMELVLERDAAALASTHAHAAPALIFPLETATVELQTTGGAARVGRAAFAIVPARTPYQLVAAHAGAAVVATLIVSDAARAAAVRDYAPDVIAPGLAEIVGAVRVLIRTRWVDELVQRYVFERSVCARQASKAARFVEAELVKEVFFLGREQLDRKHRSSVLFEGDALVARARAWIEEHLFAPFAIAALVRHCHASESTVLRAFRRELGVAPSAYARRRRLEEAHQLLESGRYAVTEVAARVGYDNPSAFAAAFRAQFGAAPSLTRPAAASLPAHGAPPVRRPRRRG